MADRLIEKMYAGRSNSTGSVAFAKDESVVVHPDHRVDPTATLVTVSIPIPWTDIKAEVEQGAIRFTRGGQKPEQIYQYMIGGDSDGR